MDSKRKKSALIKSWHWDQEKNRWVETKMKRPSRKVDVSCVAEAESGWGRERSRDTYGKNVRQNSKKRNQR